MAMEKQVEFRIRLNEVLLLGRLYFKKLRLALREAIFLISFKPFHIHIYYIKLNVYHIISK